MMLIDALGQCYNEIHGALIRSPEDVVVRHIRFIPVRCVQHWKLAFLSD